MSGLLYYIEGVRSAPLENDLKECGLLNQQVMGFCHTEIFLNKTRGSVFTLKGKCSENIKVGFYYDEQVWQNMPKDDGTPSRLWIGYYKNDKPKPCHFLKNDFIPGHELELADGNNWIIPIARKLQEGCVLPKSTVMFVANRIDEFVLDKYIPLQKIAEQVYILFNLDFDEEFKKDDEFIKDDVSFFNTCVEVLKTNYNIDFREISVLRLFTNVNTIKILKLLVDMPYIDELIERSRLEKKKETADTN